MVHTIFLDGDYCCIFIQILHWTRHQHKVMHQTYPINSTYIFLNCAIDVLCNNVGGTSKSPLVWALVVIPLSSGTNCNFIEIYSGNKPLIALYTNVAKCSNLRFDKFIIFRRLCMSSDGSSLSYHHNTSTIVLTSYNLSTYFTNHSIISPLSFISPSTCPLFML